MNLAFDLEHIQTTEFGIGHNGGEGDRFVVIPVDADVQTALHNMIVATWYVMQQSPDEPGLYEPSEKHAATEHLYLPADRPLCQPLVALHEANNLPIDVSAVNDPSRISCYFVRLMDREKNRLTTVRRAMQFKGDLKKKLMRFWDGTMQILENHVFRLDNDFDLIIDANKVHIWRPSAFEFLGGLQQTILDAVPPNVAAVSRDLPFVEFDAIQAYTVTRPRAARYLASIRTQDLAGISCVKLETWCRKTNAKISVVDGRISVDEKNIMGFLEVLDRRRYEIELVPDNPERFRAASRRKIDI